MMNCKTPTYLLASSLAILLGLPLSAQEASLIDRIPPNANTVLVVDAARLYQSALAKKENWSKLHSQGQIAGGLNLPAGTKFLVAASSMDYRYLHPSWQAMVMQMDNPPTLATVAQRSDGHIDSIGRIPAVMLPGDATLLEFDDHTVGVLTPANRQRAAEWLSFHQQPGHSLPPFLQSIAEHATTASPQIMVGLNLQNLLSPEFVQSALEHDPDAIDKDAKATLAETAKQIASLENASFSATIDNKIHGHIRLTFEQPLKITESALRMMIADTLLDSGLQIENFTEWSGIVAGHNADFNGDLTDDDLRRTLNLLDTPLHWIVDSQRSSNLLDLNSQEANGYRSLAYFQSLRKALNDFKYSLQSSSSMGAIASDLDRFATHIEHLPVVGVDAELLDFGNQTTDSLLHAAEAMREPLIAAGSQKAAVYPETSGVYQYRQVPRYRTPVYPYGYGRTYGRFGYGQSSLYFRYRNINGERSKIQAQGNAKAATAERQAIAEVESSMAKVRRQMAEKYSLEF